MRKIIRGGTVVNASESVNADVLIEGETIRGVGTFDGVDAELIDATGCYVLPGAIDNHTHLSMPFGGTWSSDDYDTGTQAAAAGGTTCIVDFALQMHPGGLRSSLEEWTPLWDALRLGHLQIVSTDHCPFDDGQKRLGLDDFSKIPNGLAAIQHRLPMLWEHGVREGRLSMNRVVEITSTAVAKMFGLHPRKGVIAAGADADIVVFDPEGRHVFSTETSFMNVDYDIYEGQEVAGSPRLTLSRGTVVFDDGAILTQPGHGRYVRRAPFDGSHV